MTAFGGDGDDLPFVRPEDVPRETIRARFFCDRHGQESWIRVAVVDANTIYTDIENASLTDATHRVLGQCRRCSPVVAGVEIDAKRVRERLRGARFGAKVRVDDVASRKSV